MAMITREAMAHEEIRKIVARSSYQVKQANGKKGRKIYSTNYFYSYVGYPKDLYSIIGSKTGTTNAAGHVFSATAIDKDGHQVICTYMGKKSKVRTFVDIKAILNKIYKSSNSGKLKLSDGTQTIKTAFDTYQKEFEDNLAFSIGAKTDSGVKPGYSSSDDTIAGVDKNGTVSCLQPGVAVITITAGETAYLKKASKKIVVSISPKTPEELSYSTADNQVYLTWNKSRGATGYRVYRREYNSQDEWQLFEVNSNKFIDTPETGEYEYRVSAVTRTRDGIAESVETEAVAVDFLNAP